MGTYIYKMPDIGEGVVEAEITAWHVAVGDTVSEEDPIADAMTDKATIELTSPVDGVITALGCEAGDMLAVGAALAKLETDEDGAEDAPEVKPAAVTAEASAPQSAAFVYKMPDIGEGVVEAEITAWHVAVGDTVSEEDPVADAMTDKATIELTSPVDGVVTALGCEAGEMLAVGGVLATFAVEGEEPQAEPEQKAKKEISQKNGSQKTTPQTKTPSLKADPTLKLLGGDKKPLASPAVRKRAREAGLNLAHAAPTGASGQVTHIDLDRLEQTLKPEEGETRIKIIGLRRVIAERMQAAKRNIPHFTYVDEIDVTDLEALRKRANTNASQNKSGQGKPKLTVLPFIIRALGMTLKEWPQFNARYMDEAGYVSQFSALNLGLATMTEKGLIVPVIKDAGRKSIWQLARDITRLSVAARENTLSAEDLSGASTTLTSLGPLGGIVTTPVINRPEVAIFGPNKIRTKLELRGGDVVERQVMNFSVSCDHRVIDGYDAAAMVQDLKRLLENPEAMFL